MRTCIKPQWFVNIFPREGVSSLNQGWIKGLKCSKFRWNLHEAIFDKFFKSFEFTGDNVISNALSIPCLSHHFTSRSYLFLVWTCTGMPHRKSRISMKYVNYVLPCQVILLVNVLNMCANQSYTWVTCWPFYVCHYMLYFSSFFKVFVTALLYNRILLTE